MPTGCAGSGALSRARQFTNQAVSDEAVQANTLDSTARARIADTLANNAMTMGQATQKQSVAANTNWADNGKAEAGVTNTKAGNAVKNAITEQEVWELAQQVLKYEYGDAIFKVWKRQEKLLEVELDSHLM